MPTKRGGSRSNAGRKPGIPNKRTESTIAKAEAEGLMPLDYMLSVLRDGNRVPADRFLAAKEAAPYLHARLASVDATVKADVEGAITFTWRPAT